MISRTSLIGFYAKENEITLTKVASAKSSHRCRDSLSAFHSCSALSHLRHQCSPDSLPPLLGHILSREPKLTLFVSSPRLTRGSLSRDSTDESETQSSDTWGQNHGDLNVSISVLPSVVHCNHSCFRFFYNPCHREYGHKKNLKKTMVQNNIVIP